MKQEVCVLPVQCKRCGGIFDLWYDLERGNFAARRGFSPSAALKQSLCWRCRQAVVNEMRGEAFKEHEADEDTFWLSFG